MRGPFIWLNGVDLTVVRARAASAEFKTRNPVFAVSGKPFWIGPAGFIRNKLHPEASYTAAQRACTRTPLAYITRCALRERASGARLAPKVGAVDSHLRCNSSGRPAATTKTNDRKALREFTRNADRRATRDPSRAEKFFIVTHNCIAIGECLCVAHEGLA